MKQVRIKDIAEKAGVSIGTVDRVLHNRGEVATHTKEKILKIAADMNYKPNLMARALKSKKRMQLVSLLPVPDEANLFWKHHLDGIKSAVNELEALQVQMHYFFFELHNASDFQTKTEEILKLTPDGVIFAPILMKESNSFAARLDELNIPYIFLDTFIENTNCISFIGENAYKSGRVAANLIDFGLPATKDVMMVHIAKDLENTHHLNLRNQGFISYFMDKGHNSGLKVNVEIPSPDETEITIRLQHLLEKHPNLGAIWVSSAKTHVIARFLESIQRDDLILVGYETTEPNVQHLKKGTIDFLISQRPFEQSEKSVKKLFEYLSYNTQPEKKDYQAIEIINRECLWTE